MDAAEAQTVPYIAGIFHPTGFPTYTLLGWAFTHLFPFGSVAWRMNLFGAVTATISVLALYQIQRLLLVGRVLASLCTLLFVVSQTVWQHVVRAGSESLTLCFASLMLYSAMRWYVRSDFRAVTLTGLFAGLAITTHPVALWFFPGTIMILFSAGKYDRRFFRSLLCSLVAFSCVLLTYLYLPIRSAIVTSFHLDPAANALGIVGSGFWNYDDPATLSGFIGLVTGAEFNAASALTAPLEIVHYGQYLQQIGNIAVGQVGWAAVVLAITGVIASKRNLRWPVVGLCTAAIMVVPFALRYYWLYDPAKYYIVSVWILCVFVGLGSVAVSEKLQRFGRYASSIPALIIASVAIWNGWNNSDILNQRNDRSGEAFISTVKNNTPNNAVIDAGWWYATSLAYAAYVTHELGDRIPLSISRVSNDQMLAARKRYPVYYLLSPTDDKTIPGAQLVAVTRSWPRLYRLKVDNVR